jgi:hypothetical protein
LEGLQNIIHVALGWLSSAVRRAVGESSYLGRGIERGSDRCSEEGGEEVVKEVVEVWKGDEEWGEEGGKEGRYREGEIEDGGDKGKRTQNT